MNFIISKIINLFIYNINNQIKFQLFCAVQKFVIINFYAFDIGFNPL